MAVEIEDRDYRINEMAEILGMTEDEVEEEIFSDRLKGKKGSGGSWFSAGRNFKKYIAEYGTKK